VKISVIVPTLNSERFLGATLDSITNQGHAEFEVVVVDGGSTDGTLAIAKGYPHTIVVSAPPRGEPNAINVGLRAATGDILTWLDSDDEYAPWCLDKVDGYFRTHPGSLWVYGKCGIINEHGGPCRAPVTWLKERFQPRYRYTSLLLFDYIAQPACFFTRRAVALAGFLDEEARLAFDYDWWLRLGTFGRPGYIGRVLAYWRSHPGSETAKSLMADMKEGLAMSIRHSPGRLHLRPLQYGFYGLAVAGYWSMGALRPSVRGESC